MMESVKKKVTKTDLNAFYEIAYFSYINGKYEKAEGFFRVLTNLKSNNATYWYGLGATLQMQRKYVEALEAYLAATVLDPKNHEYYLHAAICMHDQGKTKEAYQTVKAGLKVAKHNKDSAYVERFKLLQERWKGEQS